MKNPCKEYHVILEVLGPVHVGNGRELDKKSYIFTRIILLSLIWKSCMRI